MSKQVLLTGTVPNDGTGDDLRTGAEKINDNFNEIYNTFGNGSTLTPIEVETGVEIYDGSTLVGVATGINFGSNLNVSALSSGIVTVTSSAVGGASSISDLTDVAISSLVSGQVLKYNGVNWVNDTDASGGGSGLTSRATSAAATSSIANGASANISISAANTYSLLKVQTSAAAWVTLYTDTTSRTNDASRSEDVDPLPGSGVVAEVITTEASTVLISPAIIGFDSNSGSTVYAKVVNKSGTTQAITVTLTYVQLEV
jgi:hypothetical protein